MLEAMPESIQQEIIERLGSPRTRQNMAQVSQTVGQAVQQTDAKFYSAWLQDDFECDAPQDLGQAKEQYRYRLDINRREVSRLIDIEHTGSVSRLAADLDDALTQRNLSKRYGKGQAAHVGLRAIERLAVSVDSPPRLRDGELNDLMHAVRTLHGRSGCSAYTQQQFNTALEAASQGAKEHATKEITPIREAPGAPLRRTRSQVYAPGQHAAPRRVLEFNSLLP